MRAAGAARPLTPASKSSPASSAAMVKHAAAVAAAAAAPAPPFTADAPKLEKELNMFQLKEALESFQLASNGSRKDRAKRLAAKMKEMQAATVAPPEPEPVQDEAEEEEEKEEEEEEEEYEEEEALGKPIEILEEFDGDVDAFKVRLLGKRQSSAKWRRERCNTTNKKAQSLLHLAVEMDFEAVIPLLLKQGADVNARDKQGKTPTLVAIERGSAEALDALLAAKDLDTECYDKQGTTMLIG